MDHQRTISLRSRIRVALGAGVLGLAVLAAPSIAGAGDVNSKMQLNIPQQTLADALTSLAQQADLQILFAPDLVAGLASAGLSGSFSGAEALERLLTGLQLEYVVNGSDTIVIRARSAPTMQRISQATEPAESNSGGADASQSGSASLEEVVVTAQKRVERLQDVPLAVTALSGDALARAGVNDTASLVNLTPSLTFTEGAHPANKNFRIRGIGTAVFGQGLEPSVSVVVDGIVLARAAQGFADLADIERVEVLRGPQGTLFGKNSVGGVINVVTKRPSSTFEADADATIAEEDEYRIRGSVSGPLSDTLGARLTGYYSDVGGHIRNLTLDEDVNGHEDLGVRGKLEWDPTDRLNLLFMADYRESDTLCCSSQYISAVNPLLQQLLLPVVASFNNREEVDNRVTSSETDQVTLSVEGNLEFDAVTLTSLTAYQDFSVANEQPIDRLNTPTPLYLPVTNGYFDINDGTIDVTQLTQEFRVTSPGSESFNYVAGLYFLDLDLDRGFWRRTGGCATGGNPAAVGQPCVVPQYRSQGGFSSNTQTRNAALFGQADFALIGNLSGLAGARVQYEEISYEGVRTDTRLVAGDLALAGITPSSGSGKSDDTAVTGKAGLKYEFSDSAQAYLTWSTGYKGAGYEVEFAADFVNQQPIKPEKAKAWELGHKAQLFGGALTINTALFHAQYDDLQVQANRGNADLGIVLFATTNAGSATTEGAEIEFVAQPFSAFILSGGVTYLSSSVDIDGLNCPLSVQAAAPVIVGSKPLNVCYRPSTNPNVNPIQNVRDGDLPSAPEWRGNLTARYEFDIPGTSLGSFVQVSGNSQSKINFVIEQDPLTVHDSYTTVDASIGLHDLSSRYRLTLFVKNLFDEHYLTSIARAATLTTRAVTPDNLTGNVPKEANRYFGATFGVSF
jgi:iron complex outermembrane receptor protein